MNEHQHVGLPTSPEALMASAARADNAKHTISLFLAESRDEIDRDLLRALARALRRVPAGRSLRREKDRKIVRAVRCLMVDVDPNDRRYRELELRLTDAERRSGLRA